MNGAGLLRLAPPLVVSLLLAGCGGPVLVFPGGALSGQVVHEPVDDWSFVDAAFVDLETRPEDRYSVKINFVVKAGKLYIDPGDGRVWHDNLRADPRCRVRFGERIYPVTAVLVGKPGEIAGFDADRFVYRLDSRGD